LLLNAEFFEGFITPLPFIVVGKDGPRWSKTPPLLTIMRETTISVSHDEKDRLDDAKAELFGTDEVPYGAVITELVDRID
jgi:hypothetical protein